MCVQLIDDRDKPSPDWTRPAEPPIHWAARKGDLELLDRVIGEGADINQRADLEHDNGPHMNGLTTLMIAARSIDGATVETLRWLVEHGADFKARSEGGNTAAWYAAGHGGRWEFHKEAVTTDHTERLRYLLDLGLDAEECNFIGRSLLTEACEAGDASRVQLLLDRGASPVVSGTARPQRSILSRMASMLGDGDLQAGADVPRGDCNSFQIPIFCAASSGSAECVRMLLDRGADPNSRDSSGSTPLMSAGSASVVNTLLVEGADLDAVDEFGKDAFETVIEESCGTGACGPERFDVAQALVRAGADIERVDQYGKTRLASAAFGHHADAVQFLLKLGARADVRDAEGGTPLHSICWQGEYQDSETNAACGAIIRALVAAGVAVDASDSKGSTAMHEAARGDWGNQTAIRTLLDLGAAADPADSNGDTPLVLAAQNGEIGCIKLLLEAGADPCKANMSGTTPLAAADSHLKSWQSIVASGPDSSIAEMQMEMNEEIARELGCPIDEDETDLSSLIGEQEDQHRSALNEAQQSFDTLDQAAKGLRD